MYCELYEALLRSITLTAFSNTPKYRISQDVFLITFGVAPPLLLLASVIVWLRNGTFNGRGNFASQWCFT